MRRRQRAAISELRQAVECLPRTTKIAMLEGMRANEIIAGAYTDRGGVCPMLAAHRAGGRTSLISFARAWDRFAFREARFAFPGARAGRARRATERELLVLKAHLQASLLEGDAPTAELARAIAEHRALVGQRSPGHEQDRPQPDRRPPAGDRDRSRELRGRDGWAWLRVFRRYDDYQGALDRLAGEREKTAA